MTRPPRTVRLAELSPEDVGALVAGRIRDHVGTWAPLSGPRAQSLATDAAFLVRWTQGGDGSAARAGDVLAAFVAQLFASPLARAPDEPALDVTDPIQLVLAAASARVKIEAGQPVPAVQLAALLGVDQSRIRQLVLAGELRRTTAEQKRGRQMDAPILATDARKMLAAREA